MRCIVVAWPDVAIIARCGCCRLRMSGVHGPNTGCIGWLTGRAGNGLTAAGFEAIIGVPAIPPQVAQPGCKRR
jgi:hypothetical protein